MLRVGMMTENINRFKNIKESLKIIKDLGFECADITLMIPGNNSKLNGYFTTKDYLEKAKGIKEYAESINLPLVQAHAPFPVIKIGDNRYNKRMFAKLIKCIEICGVLKIKNLVIHPFNDYKDEENIEFFRKLLPYAKENDVVICTENMWRWNKEINRARPCACSLTDSFINTVRGVNDPNLKACVDIGHAEMFSHMGLTPRKLIEGLNEDVYCLHIHDNDGIHDNHFIALDGVIDYDDVVKGLKNINYNGDLITETTMPSGKNNFNELLDYWRHQLDTVLKIKEKILS